MEKQSGLYVNLEDTDYSQLFYDLELNSPQEKEFLKIHIDLLTEIELEAVSLKTNDHDKRYIQKCQIYRRRRVQHLHPDQAESIHLDKKYNQLYQLFFNLYCNFDEWSQGMTVADVCQLIRNVPTKCSSCDSDHWMEDTFRSGTSLMCGKCQNNVTLF